MTRDDPLSSWFDEPAPQDDTKLPGRTLPGREGDMPATGPALHRRRTIVVVGLLAAVVWSGAAALWLTGNDTASRAPASNPTTPSAPGGTPPATPVLAPVAPSEPNRWGPGSAPAAAVAEITVHERVTGTGDERWIDAAALERWIPLTDGALRVGIVRAVLLEAGNDGWERRRQARYAVAVRCDDDCRPASDPWPVPLEGASPFPEEHASGEAPEQHAAALVAAGYTDPQVDVVSQPLPDVVEVEVVAVPPGGTQRRTHRVWLHTSPYPAVVGATVPARSASPEPRR